MLSYRWTNIYDAGPSLNQRFPIDWSLLVWAAHKSPNLSSLLSLWSSTSTPRCIKSVVAGTRVQVPRVVLSLWSPVIAGPKYPERLITSVAFVPCYDGHNMIMRQLWLTEAYILSQTSRSWDWRGLMFCFRTSECPLVVQVDWGLKLYSVADWPVADLLSLIFYIEQILSRVSVICSIVTYIK